MIDENGGVVDRGANISFVDDGNVDGGGDEDRDRKRYRVLIYNKYDFIFD